MNLTINGAPHEIEENLTIEALLDKLNLAPERVVLELNREILTTRDALPRQLKHDDRLEIIQFVGGG